MNTEKQKTLVVVDGNSLMFRAYYATSYTGNLMQTSTGIYTNALFGFINMFNKLLEVTKPDYIMVAFDKGKKTFRHMAYSDYKGTRKHMPEELAMQIDLIKEYLDIMQIKRLELDGYEADDIVGSYATLGANAGMNVLAFSGDKDLLQLVSDNVTVFLTKKGMSELDEYNVNNFFEKLSFHPYQHVDYKAMIGDSSDNLPGIKGVGPKTALTLLEKYETLEEIINHADELKGKLAELVKESKEVALQTKFLATIVRNIELPFTLEELELQNFNYHDLRVFYEKLEFSSFIKKLPVDNVESSSEVAKKKEIKINKNDIQKLKDTLNKKLYLEVELTHQNYHKGHIFGLSILCEDEAFFFEESYLYNDDLKSILENQDIKKSTIDLKKVYASLTKYDIYLKGCEFDFLLASYVLDPSTTTTDVKVTFENYVSNDLAFFDDVYGKKSECVIPAEDVYMNYSVEKLILLKKVEDDLVKKLIENNQLSIVMDIELPLAVVLAKTELNGFYVNKKRLVEIGEELTEKINALQAEIYELAGCEFNISSPKQLGVILFEKIGLGHGKKTKTGYSTNAEVLEALSKEHILPGRVLEYRKYTKLYSTYVVGLLSEINNIDGKVHTTFKQTLTQTGRLSSVEPNIQNIPVRTEDGKIVRSAFESSFEDGYLVSCDYSQIELRVLAYMAKCHNMLEAFKNKQDLHASTASKVYNVSYEDVTKDMRRVAKTVNFGIVYGMSDWGLSESLHITPAEANLFIEKYFAVYPEIKEFLDNEIKKAYDLGYTLTLFNRKRHIKELKSSNYMLRKFGERTAMNSPIQGSAADIIKIAMIKVDEALTNLNLKAKIVSQVHDELVIDTPSDELEVVTKLVKETMEQAIDFDLELVAEVEYGKNWDLK